VTDRDAAVAALLRAFDDWQTFYGDVDIEDDNDTEGSMDQLDHGYEEYVARIAVMWAGRAVLDLTEGVSSRQHG
jgi:hypothetical protein